MVRKILTMIPAGNKAKRLSSVNHSAKAIHPLREKCPNMEFSLVRTFPHLEVYFFLFVPDRGLKPIR